MTLFKDIYEMNEILRNDNRLRLKTTNQIYKLYFKYLQYSIGLFQRDCYKDLSNRINFSQNEFLFNANGIDNDFQLTSVPSSDYEFYVGYKCSQDFTYTEVISSNYSFDSNNNVLTITLSILPVNTIVYIVPYVIGSFNDNLDLDEINILIEGMNIPFLEEQQNRNSLLTQIVYSGSQKMNSQASHISSVHNVSESQSQKVIEMINRYSYKANPNKLKGLGVSV